MRLLYRLRCSPDFSLSYSSPGVISALTLQFFLFSTALSCALENDFTNTSDTCFNSFCAQANIGQSIFFFQLLGIYIHGCFSPANIKENTLELHDLAQFHLITTKSKKVRVVCLATSGMCVGFMVSFLDTEGSGYGILLGCFSSISVISILITQTLTAIDMRRRHNSDVVAAVSDDAAAAAVASVSAEKENKGSPSNLDQRRRIEEEAGQEPSKFIFELSLAYYFCALLGATVISLSEAPWAFCDISSYDASLYSRLSSWVSSLVPIVSLATLVAMYSKPRGSMWWIDLPLHALNIPFNSFVAIGYARRGYFLRACAFMILAALIACFIMRILVPLRSALADFSDEKLSAFMVEKLLKPALAVTVGMLFLFFKTAQCQFSTEIDHEHCMKIGLVQVALSSVLLIPMVTDIIITATTSGSSSLRSRFSLVKLTLLDFDVTEKLSVLLMLVVGMMSAFMLSVVFSESTGYSRDVIQSSAFATPPLCICIVWLEWRKHDSKEIDGKTSAQRAQEEAAETLVTEIATPYLVCGFVFSLVYAYCDIRNSITQSEESFRARSIAVVPAFLFCVLSFSMKPKRQDSSYKLFVFIHLMVQGIVPNLIYIFWHAFIGTAGLISILAVALKTLGYCVAFCFLLELRKILAGRPDDELSEFLTHTVLKETVGSFFSLAFLIIEALGSGSVVSVAVSSFLGLLKLFLVGAIVYRKSIPIEAQLVHEITLERLANFDLLKREKIEGLLVAMCALSGIVLFPFLGTELDAESKYAPFIYFAGYTGVASGAFAFVAILITAVRTSKRLEEEKKLRKGRQRRITFTRGSIARDTIGLTSFGGVI